MNFDTSPRVPIFAVPHVYLSDNAIEMAKRTIREGSVRSVVQPWQSYLPEDCLNTMIKMGGDRTTRSGNRDSPQLAKKVVDS